jgi:putative nucleotidyltransferase with HDIG domain
MKKLINFIRDRHAVLYKMFLFLITVIGIVYLFPKEGKFKYEFQKGRPWLHEDLIAPFDFAVLKSEEQLRNEEASLRENAAVYLNYSDQVAIEKLEWLRAELDALEETQFSLQEENWKSTIIQLVQYQYDRGIFQPDDRMNKYPSGRYFLIRGGQMTEIRPSDLPVIKEVIAQLESTLRDRWGEDRFDILSDPIMRSLAHNVFFDEKRTTEVLDEEIAKISTTQGVVQKGQSIILKGEVVDESKYLKLMSLKGEYETQSWTESSYYWIVGGQFLLVGITLSVLFFFLMYFRPFILEDNNQITFILLNIFLACLAAAVAIQFDPTYMYLVPFCILPLILRAFFDARVAIFTHFVTILIIGFMAPNPFEFTYLQLIAGITSILTVKSLYKRVELFLAVAKIIVIYFVSYFAIAIIQEGSLRDIQLINFAYFAGNGALTLFVIPMIYAFEKIFRLVSDASLLELSDINNKLLRELSEKAPGTFQHSLQVANLAESVIHEIGGSALLARTGALYHDIGKMKSPLYFIENQRTGVNPHDELPFEESARIIIEHVGYGVELAKKNRLPDRIIDFIRTHHGTSMVQYFYRQYIKNFPDEIIDQSMFRYPGPKPFSKETAVVMMSDAVEAASKSLSKPDAFSINKLVDSIIDAQMKDGQFENADITFKEITKARKIFKKKLQNIFHLRIEYPE